MSLHTVAAAQARYWAEAGPGKAYGGAYSVGYSQPYRRTVYANSDEAGWLTANADADCSSLVCGAINFGLHGAHGVPWGHPALLEINDFWTGNMRGGLEARGFYEVSWNDSDLYPAGGLRIGDVLLSAKNEGGRGHVVMVTSDGYVSESWVNSQNGDGWDEPDEPVGDQTGGETRTIAYTAHPDTLNGRWTSCHRFDEARFLAQWPEFASGAAPAPAPAAPASSSEPAHAHGVDVSSYQAGIDFSVVPADFVIVKVTQGAWYVNPAWRDQVASALANGKRLALYHFADDDPIDQQVEFFLANAADFLGRAPLWLDWEADAVPLGPGAAQAWLDAVAARTGTTPGFYTYQNVLHSYDWSAVAARYPLWVAGGPDYSDYGSSYMDPAVPDVPYWGTSALVHQYTEDGRLPGWGDHIDLNRLRDRAAWDAMVGATAPAATTTDTTTGDDEMIFISTERGDDKVKEYTILRGGFPPLRVAGIIETSYRQVCGNPIFQWPDFYDRTVADWQAAYDRLVADTAAATAAAIKGAAA